MITLGEINSLTCYYEVELAATSRERHITLTGGQGIVDRENGTLAVKQTTLGDKVDVRNGRYAANVRISAF